jgi:MoaA/NifB/PqqE/SkfB family radical SAM enzyme
MLAEGGVKLLKVLGGEPTLLPWLPDFIKEVTARTGMKISLLTNCHSFTPELGEELVRSRLFAIQVSYDIISDKAVDAGMQHKALDAPRVMEEMNRLGIVVIANTMLTGYNLSAIPDLVPDLTRSGIWTNICTPIYGCGPFIFRSDDDSIAFTEIEVPKLRELSHTLRRLKQQSLIVNSCAYLDGLAGPGITLDWHCPTGDQLSMLQIDYDGTVLVCPDVEGDRRYRVQDLAHQAVRADFQIRHAAAVKACSGCYWSAVFGAANDPGGLPPYFHY